MLDQWGLDHDAILSVTNPSFRWLLDQWGLDLVLCCGSLPISFRWLLDQWGSNTQNKLAIYWDYMFTDLCD